MSAEHTTFSHYDLQWAGTTSAHDNNVSWQLNYALSTQTTPDFTDEMGQAPMNIT